MVYVDLKDLSHKLFQKQKLSLWEALEFLENYLNYYKLYYIIKYKFLKV